jgi:hypothetical protein
MTARAADPGAVTGAPPRYARTPANLRFQSNRLLHNSTISFRSKPSYFAWVNPVSCCGYVTYYYTKLVYNESYSLPTRKEISRTAPQLISQKKPGHRTNDDRTHSPVPQRFFRSDRGRTSGTKMIKPQVQFDKHHNDESRRAVTPVKYEQLKAAAQQVGVTEARHDMALQTGDRSDVLVAIAAHCGALERTIVQLRGLAGIGAAEIAGEVRYLEVVRRSIMQHVQDMRADLAAAAAAAAVEVTCPGCGCTIANDDEWAAAHAKVCDGRPRCVSCGKLPAECFCGIGAQ